MKAQSLLPALLLERFQGSLVVFASVIIIPLDEWTVHGIASGLVGLARAR